MNDADKAMYPQHLGSDPADTRIQIRITQEIRIHQYTIDALLLPRLGDCEIYCK